MKITVYTIADDPFCKEEKEYLTTKNLQFEERNLESDRKVLEEMLALSDNFAGVPFTVVTKDDGTQLKLKGFTKEEFEEALLASKMDNISQANSDMKVPPTTEPVQPTTSTASDLPTPVPSNQMGSPVDDIPTVTPAPVTTDQPAMSQSPQPSTSQPLTPATTMADSNPQKDLEGILSTLSSSGGANEPTAPQESAPGSGQMPSPTISSPTTPAATTTPSMPSIPDFKSE